MKAPLSLSISNVLIDFTYWMKINPKICSKKSTQNKQIIAKGILKFCRLKKRQIQICKFFLVVVNFWYGITYNIFDSIQHHPNLMLKVSFTSYDIFRTCSAEHACKFNFSLLHFTVRANYFHFTSFQYECMSVSITFLIFNKNELFGRNPTTSYQLGQWLPYIGHENIINQRTFYRPRKHYIYTNPHMCSSIDAFVLFWFHLSLSVC